LDNVTDFGLAHVQLKVSDFAINVDKMAQNEGIFTAPQLQEQFTEMKERVKKLAKKITNDDLRSKFVGKLVI